MCLNLGHHPGHENSGCSFASGPGAGGFAPARGASGSAGPYASRGRPAVRGGARNSERLDGPLGARRECGAEGPASRTAAPPALGSLSGGHHRAVDSEPVSGPVAFAVRAVDAGSGAAVAGPTVRRARIGLDGGALFAGLGSDAAEASATRVRTKPGRRAALVGAGIPGHPGASQARKGRDSLGRRDGAAFGPSSRPVLRASGPDAGGSRHWSAIPVQHDLSHHQSRSTGLHGVSPALHRAGLPEFSASPAASDPKESVSDFGSPPRAQVCAGESLAGEARGAHPALLASLLQPGTESR